MQQCSEEACHLPGWQHRPEVRPESEQSWASLSCVCIPIAHQSAKGIGSLGVSRPWCLRGGKGPGKSRGNLGSSHSIERLRNWSQSVFYVDKNQDITLGLPPPTVHSLIPVYTGYPDNSVMLCVRTRTAKERVLFPCCRAEIWFWSWSVILLTVGTVSAFTSCLHSPGDTALLILPCLDLSLFL